MPHDMNGNELKVDDIVVVPCRVLAVHLTRDYCNVDLETAVGMPPSMDTTRLTLNSKQVICESPAAPPAPPAVAEPVRCNTCDQPILHELVCEDCLSERGIGPAAAEWQPMETAPKDAEILAFDEGAIFITYWDDATEHWIDNGPIDPPPTHWMPLPAPPVAARGEPDK